MRDKHLLRLFLGLNVALAACFVVYLILSSNNQPAFVSTAFPIPAPKTNVIIKMAAPEIVSVPTNVSTNALTMVASNAPALTNLESPQPVFVQKRIGWDQLQADEATTNNSEAATRDDANDHRTSAQHTHVNVNIDSDSDSSDDNWTEEEDPDFPDEHTLLLDTDADGIETDMILTMLHVENGVRVVLELMG